MVQVVLITGCSSGIGRQLAIEFSQRKDTFVFASARNIKSMEDLKADYSNIDTLELDVTKEDSIKKAIASIISTKGRIDILVNNAGNGVYGASVEITIEECKRLFGNCNRLALTNKDVNVFGAIATIQEVYQHMVKQGGGKIVNICSVAGILSVPFSGPYSASKAALRSWSDALRLELAPFNIKVLVVDPGFIKSSFAENAKVKNSQHEKPESFYYSIEDAIQKRVELSKTQPSTPTDEFARKTVDYVSSASSPHLLYGALSSYAAFVARWLPTWLTDYILSKRFGLLTLKEHLQSGKVKLS